MGMILLINGYLVEIILVKFNVLLNCKYDLLLRQHCELTYQLSDRYLLFSNHSSITSLKMCNDPYSK
jgi:hypothetical protein